MTKEEIKEKLQSNLDGIFDGLDFYETVELFLEMIDVISHMDGYKVKCVVKPNFQKMLFDNSIPYYVRIALMRLMINSVCPHKRELLSGKEICDWVRSNHSEYLKDKEMRAKLDCIRHTLDPSFLLESSKEKRKEFFGNFDQNVENYIKMKEESAW